ncbi:hypothetical protein GCM10027170_41290 [Aliiglaciecola aliphaticivorans]
MSALNILIGFVLLTLATRFTSIESTKGADPFRLAIIQYRQFFTWLKFHRFLAKEIGVLRLLSPQNNLSDLIQFQLNIHLLFVE